MRVEVNGVYMTSDVVMGGLYAVLSLDAAPILNTPQLVNLFKRTGELHDSFTYTPLAYTGPTLTSVAPTEGAVGTLVTITGTGFLGGPARVFFGGIESPAAGVTVMDDSSIEAAVPSGAGRGLVYVLIGAEAAEGLVGFQPLDAFGFPVLFPEFDPVVHAAFPAHGVVDTPVRIYGVNIDVFTFPLFNDTFSTNLFGIEPLTVPLIGEIVCTWGVVLETTDPGAGTLLVDLLGLVSNELPFTVDP